VNRKSASRKYASVIPEVRTSNAQEVKYHRIVMADYVLMSIVIGYSRGDR
jgi:hypothetical protein